jgi:hypothetical protein
MHSAETASGRRFLMNTYSYDAKIRDRGVVLAAKGTTGVVGRVVPRKRKGHARLSKVVNRGDMRTLRGPGGSPGGPRGVPAGTPLDWATGGIGDHARQFPSTPAARLPSS